MPGMKREAVQTKDYLWKVPLPKEPVPNYRKGGEAGGFFDMRYFPHFVIGPPIPVLKIAIPAAFNHLGEVQPGCQLAGSDRKNKEKYETGTPAGCNRSLMHKTT